MDNRTLKALVIELKEKELTYREISYRLERDYKIKRSRQALQGMYTRAVRDNLTDKQKERIIATSDVVNIYCLGYNRKEVARIIGDMGYNLTYNDVVVMIRDETNYIKDVSDYNRMKITEYLGGVNDIEELRRLLSYKGVKPTDKQVKKYVTGAYNLIIKDRINEVLADAYKFTDDKNVIKKVADNIDYKLDYAEVNKNL